MWIGTSTARQEDIRPTIKKKMVNYYISENTLNRFKQVCDKEARNYSKVIENFMIRYVRSRI
jgi:hypothetical protein